MFLNSEFKMVDNFWTQKLVSGKIFKDSSVSGPIYEYLKNSLIFCNEKLRIQWSETAKRMVLKTPFVSLHSLTLIMGFGHQKME